MDNHLVLEIVLRIAGVFVALAVGRWLAGRCRLWVAKGVRHAELPASLGILFDSVAYYGIWLLTILVVLALVGVPVEVLITGVAVVVVVLAIALQQSLGNLASTILIILFKPFKVGDVIETNGMVGVVQEIQMFSTVLQSLENTMVTFPNSQVHNNMLVNLSTNATRRVELVYGVSYDDDLQLAKQVIAEVMQADSRVLAEPAPTIFVQELGDSSVNIAVWLFIKVEDYLEFKTDIHEKVKQKLEANGLSIPYPQRDVHVLNQS